EAPGQPARHAHRRPGQGEEKRRGSGGRSVRRDPGAAADRGGTSQRDEAPATGEGPPGRVSRSRQGPDEHPGVPETARAGRQDRRVVALAERPQRGTGRPAEPRPTRAEEATLKRPLNEMNPNATLARPTPGKGRLSSPS